MRVPGDWNRAVAVVAKRRDLGRSFFICIVNAFFFFFHGYLAVLVRLMELYIYNLLFYLELVAPEYCIGYVSLFRDFVKFR